MKKKRIFLIIGILILVIAGIFLVLYNVFRDKNSLNILERTWINNNKSKVITFNVENNHNIFSSDGEGVFYDFMEDFSDEYDLEVNPNVVSNEENVSLGFNEGFDLSDNDLLIYTDNYVLISKTLSTVADINNVKNKKIGMLTKDSAEIAKYYALPNNTLSNYETSSQLLEEFKNGNLDYVILPLNDYKNVILENDYKVVYHFDDLKVYYYFTKGEDKTLNSIITKFYNNWILNKGEKYYYKHNYDLFIDSLKISEVEEATLTNKDYLVGVVDMYPYQFMRAGNFNGIINTYLEDFIKFANVDLKYKKYKTSDSLVKAVSNNKVNLAFNPYISVEGVTNIGTNIGIDYVLIEDKNSQNVYDSIASYRGNLYVLENTYLEEYLKNNSNITIKTYKNNKELKRIIKKGNPVILDKLTYETYVKELSDNYNIRIEGSLANSSYSFMYSGVDTFSKLFSSYIMTLNDSIYKLRGTTDFTEAYLSGNQVSSLAKYVLIFLAILILLVIYFVRRSKRIVLNTKMKKDEKLKFVDMLTSLKNRNYLNENMESWNQNTIYPQAVIVIDLNNIKYLNDTYGHEEGDKQIKSAANVLFKTQPDNTEIMRTDGNEFMVYMVGYSEKQVISYIKKLMKEFKKLPYDYSAAVGFSMIVDDLKLIDDAINEASEMMRENKENFGENSDEVL